MDKFSQTKFAKLLGFNAEEKQTNVKTEIVAGLVTFLAMAYILTVNPDQILGFNRADAYWPSVFMATALGAIIGTLLLAFVAKMPLAQASGMGLNSLLGGLVGAGAVTTYGDQFSLGQAFMLVLISGLVFLALTLIKINGKTFRELVFDGMPVPVRSAISVGIGLFIAYIGFQGAKIIVDNPYTLGDLILFSKFDINVANALVCFIGLGVIAILDKLNVKGSVIFGILAATIIGCFVGVTDLSVLAGTQDGISWKFWENWANFFGDKSVFFSFTTVFKNGLLPEGVSVFTVIMLVITMCMIDMFDTMGTIVGCCGGNRILSDENNKPRNYDKIMIADAVATCSGAMLGTSTVTTFVESGAGVSAGGRTGLTAFTVACLFFLATFAMPLFAVIPGAATASALVYVGVLMMKNNVKSVDFSDAIGATSAFLTISVMVLAYSITKGIGVGLVSYVLMSTLEYLIKLVKYAIDKKEKPTWNVSVIAIIVTVLFLAYFFVPAV
ncbi:MAG: NCS2 family permease [Clostridia bacterium]|nr:NCS2 family permease [Clostridia bacterium]